MSSKKKADPESRYEPVEQADDGDSWDAAIAEWDESVDSDITPDDAQDFEQGTAETSSLDNGQPHGEDAHVPASADSNGSLDPLMSFFGADGEIEIADGAGTALGVLLDNSALAAAERPQERSHEPQAKASATSANSAAAAERPQERSHEPQAKASATSANSAAAAERPQERSHEPQAKASATSANSAAAAERPQERSHEPQAKASATTGLVAGHAEPQTPVQRNRIASEQVEGELMSAVHVDDGSEISSALPLESLVESPTTSILHGVEDTLNDDEPLPAAPLLDERQCTVDLAALKSSSPERIAQVDVDRSCWDVLGQALASQVHYCDSVSLAAELQLVAGCLAEQVGESTAARECYREALEHRPKDIAALVACWAAGDGVSGAGPRLDLLGRLIVMLDGKAARYLQGFTGELLSLSGATDLADGPSSSMRELLVACDSAFRSGDAQRRIAAVRAVRDAVSEGSEARAVLTLELARLSEADGRNELAARCYGEVADSAAACRTEALEGAIRMACARQRHADLAHLLLESAARLADRERQAPDGSMNAARAAATAWTGNRIRRAAHLAANHHLDGFDVQSIYRRAVECSPAQPLVQSQRFEHGIENAPSEMALEVAADLAAAQSDPRQQAAWLLDASGMVRKLDHGRATEYLRRALETAPGRLWGAPALALLRIESDDPEQRIQGLRQMSAGEADASRRAAYRLAIARLLHDSQRKPEATEELARAIEDDPDCDRALELLESVCLATDQIETLVSGLDRVAELGSDASQAVALRKRAADILCDTPSGRAEEALRRYRALVQHAPFDDLVCFGIERALLRLGRLDQLPEDLGRAASATPLKHDACRRWSRRGDFLLRYSPEDAAAAYQLALQSGPAESTVRWRLIWALAVNGDPGAAASLIRAMAAEAREDEATAAAAWLRLGSWCESVLGDTSASVEAYARVPVVASEQLLSCLWRASDADGRPRSGDGAVASCLDALLRSLPAEDPRHFAVALLGAEAGQRSGAWSRERISEAIGRASVGRPEHPLIWRTLAAVETHHKDWSRLLDLQLQRSDGGGANATLAREGAAEIALWLDRPSIVRDAYSALLADEPSHLAALRFLQSDCCARNEMEGYLALMVREARATEAAADAAAIWGEVAHQQWMRADPAADVHEGGACEEAYERDPNDLIALQRLLTVAYESGGSERTTQLLRHIEQMASTEGERALCLTRAAEQLQDRDPVQAKRLYRDALQRMPSFVGASRRLSELARREQDWATAYEASSAEARHCETDSLVLEGHRLAAAIAGDQLHDLPRSIAHLRHVVEFEDQFDAQTELVRLLEQEQSWTELVDVLEMQLASEQCRDPNALRWRIVRTCMDQLNNTMLARTHLLQLLDQETANQSAWLALADIEQQDQNFNGAVDALEQAIGLERASSAKCALLLRVASIQQEELRTIPAAIRSLDRALALDPEHLEVIRRLSDLLFRAKKFRRALQTTEQLRDLELDRAARVRHMLRIAQIYEEGLGDQHRAATAYRSAYEASPDTLEVVAELRAFYQRQDDKAGAAIYLDRALSTMRRLLDNPARAAYAARAIHTLQGWRDHYDGRVCAAQLVQTIADVGSEQAEALVAVEDLPLPNDAFAGDEHDSLLFDPLVSAGIRHTFDLLAQPLTRAFKGDLKSYGLTKNDCLGQDHPVRRAGDPLARALGVPAYECYLGRAGAAGLVVDHIDVPVVIVREDLAGDQSERSLDFMMGRALWLISKKMIVPSKLGERDFELLLAAIVRQYRSEYQPPEVDEALLHQRTKQVDKLLSRRLRQRLMPFALECSGGGSSAAEIQLALQRSADRAGLIASRSLRDACAAVRRMDTTTTETQASEGGADKRGARERALLLFGASDEYLTLRQALGISARESR